MNNVHKILQKVDFLGFSTIAEAQNAILTHPDWETRWDVSDLSTDDIQELRHWAANAPLAQEKLKFQGLSNPQILRIADVSYQLDQRFARRKADKPLQYNARLVANSIVKELSGQVGVDIFAEEWIRLAVEGDNCEDSN